MRRRACRLLAAVAALAGVVLLLTAPVAAEAADEVGWWYKARQGAIGELVTQRPPNVPEGGLYVAQDVEPAAVAALRYQIPGLESAVLQLTVAEGSTALGSEIVACPTFSSWSPVEGGRWTDRPLPQCDLLSIGGSVDTSGTVVTWVLPSTFGETGSINLMLLPAEDAPPFQVAFKEPGETSLIASLLPGPETTTTTFTAPPPPPSFEPPPVDGGGFTFVPPPSTEFSPPPPADVEVPTTTAATRPARNVAAPSLPVPESRTARIVAVGTLLALAAFLYWLGNQPVPAPRLLGALASSRAAAPSAAPPAVRGIGRFARPRSTPPERLA